MLLVESQLQHFQHAVGPLHENPRQGWVAGRGVELCCTYIYIYIYLDQSIDLFHLYVYIYRCSPCPTARVRMHILPIYPEQLLGNDCQNPRIQKSKTPKTQKIQKSKTFHIYGILHCFLDFWILGFLFFLDFWILGFLDFGIFGFLDFGIFGFWDFWILGFLDFGISGCLYSGSLDLWVSAHQELHFRVP